MSNGQFSARIGCRLGKGSSPKSAVLANSHISLCGTLARPFVTRRDARIDECLQCLISTKNLSDRWIAPFIHIQTFLGTIDDTYASMKARGGGDLIQVTRGSLERHFDSVRALVERDLSRCPSSTGVSCNLTPFIEANRSFQRVQYALTSNTSKCASRNYLCGRNFGLQSLRVHIAYLC